MLNSDTILNFFQLITQRSFITPFKKIVFTEMNSFADKIFSLKWKKKSAEFFMDNGVERFQSKKENRKHRSMVEVNLS